MSGHISDVEFYVVVSNRYRFFCPILHILFYSKVIDSGKYLCYEVPETGTQIHPLSLRWPVQLREICRNLQQTPDQTTLN